MSLIVSKSFASSNVAKTSMSLNFFTIFNRQIFVKTTITSTNFLFDLSILFVNQALTTFAKESFNKLIKDLKKSLLFIKRTKKLKSTS